MHWKGFQTPWTIEGVAGVKVSGRRQVRKLPESGLHAQHLEPVSLVIGKSKSTSLQLTSKLRGFLHSLVPLVISPSRYGGVFLTQRVSESPSGLDTEGVLGGRLDGWPCGDVSS